jgi:hypothetical protein
VETVLDHSDVETVLVATDNSINSAVVEPLFKALSDSNLTAGMGPFWSFAPTAPHDAPLILVGEKACQIGKRRIWAILKSSTWKREGSAGNCRAFQFHGRRHIGRIFE